jgi:hypothetical protein
MSVNLLSTFFKQSSTVILAIMVSYYVRIPYTLHKTATIGFGAGLPTEDLYYKIDKIKYK